MLIFSRKVGESIVIDRRIRVKIVRLDVGRGQVKVGIEAPTEVEVLREEIALGGRALPISTCILPHQPARWQAWQGPLAKPGRHAG
jgi:carbon storage regulator CsrA